MLDALAALVRIISKTSIQEILASNEERMSTFQSWFIDTVELIKNIGDILATCASVGLLVIAVIGLRQWRAELRGRTELDAARSALKNILEIKYALVKCRIPLCFASEFSDREIQPGETEIESRELNQEYAYQKRISQLITAVLKFEATAIEAEVLWGEETVDVRNEVIGLCNSLSKAYSAYFPNALRDARLGKDKHEDWVEAERRVLFVMMNDDEFGVEVKNVFSRAEKTFRKYLFGQQTALKSKINGRRA